MTPPHTNRGVTTPETRPIPPVECGLDWLQYSVPWPRDLREWPEDFEQARDVIAQALPPHDELVISGEILRPIRGYSDGVGLSFGRVFWHSGQRHQHIGVIFSGEDMRTAVSVMLPHSQMLSWVMAKARKIARLDFAVDVFDPRADPRDLLHLWKRGEVGTQARTVKEEISWTYTREKGLVSAPTVYFGRGDSERMLRVYDKAKQMGTAGHWVRIELQTRDDQSYTLAQSMQSAGIPTAGRQAVRNFIRADTLDWYRLAMDGPVVGMAPVGRRETNTDKWLRTVALPALKRTATEYATGGNWSLYDELDKALGEIRRDVRKAKEHGTQSQPR